MKHDMQSVMQAVFAARAEGDRPLPVLTSNQCHALAQELNKLAGYEKPVEITREMVAELRQATGEGLVSCHKALIAHNGNKENAIEHLRCEGQAVARSRGRQPCGCPVK